uniref:Uncharacterized protein n=1 Tax=Arundo donax TaxID=35708 RepID=A0A0A9GW26_ARUDO
MMLSSTVMPMQGWNPYVVSFCYLSFCSLLLYTKVLVILFSTSLHKSYTDKQIRKKIFVRPKAWPRFI